MERAFLEFSRVIVQSGNLCLTVPNGFGAYGIINDLILASVGRKARARAGWRNVGSEHFQKFTPNSMKALPELYKFEVTKFINLEALTSFYASLFGVLRIKRSAWKSLENADIESAEKISRWFGSIWIVICKRSH